MQEIYPCQSVPLCSTNLEEIENCINQFSSIQRTEKKGMETQVNALGLGKKACLDAGLGRLLKDLTALKIQNKNQDREFKALLLIVSNHSIINSNYNKYGFQFFFSSAKKYILHLSLAYSHLYSWQHGLNCVGPLKCRYFNYTILVGWMHQCGRTTDVEGQL